MKPIHFRGQNYDPQMLGNLAGQGHRQTVPTADIITLVAVASIGVRVATMVEGKFHLLTGALDDKSPAQELYVLSKHVLKKAAVRPSTYGERTSYQGDDRRVIERNAYNRMSPEEQKRARFPGHFDQLRGYGNGR